MGHIKISYRPQETKQTLDRHVAVIKYAPHPGQQEVNAFMTQMFKNRLLMMHSSLRSQCPTGHSVLSPIMYWFGHEVH